MRKRCNFVTVCKIAFLRFRWCTQGTGSEGTRIGCRCKLTQIYSNFGYFFAGTLTLSSVCTMYRRVNQCRCTCRVNFKSTEICAIAIDALMNFFSGCGNAFWEFLMFNGFHKCRTISLSVNQPFFGGFHVANCFRRFSRNSKFVRWSNLFIRVILENVLANRWKCNFVEVR